MKKEITAIVALLSLLPAFASGTPGKSDVEIWNEGVENYRAGDFTNALRRLRPLMLSRSHGSRAAEVVAKIEYDAARTPGATNALERLEEAAAAAQIALRSAPEDKRLNDNFSKAVSALPELRKARHVNDVLESAKNRNPESVLKGSRDAVRKLIGDDARRLKIAMTNDAAGAVAMSDAMAAKCEELADSWLPLKEVLCRSVTNESELAEISKRVDDARAKTQEAARLLGDISEQSRFPLAEAESEFTDFHKALVLPPGAADESLLCQSNAYSKVQEECGRDWTRESLDYVRAFRMKFPAWAKEYEQMQSADTNKPPFKVEDQAKVSALAVELEKLHLEIVEADSKEKREKALKCTEEIIGLLPKDNNSQGGNSPQSKPDAKPENGKNDKKQNNEGDDGRQQDPGDPSGEEDSKDKDRQKQQPAGDGKDKEIEAVLKKAQERSDEHEAQKKAREMRRRLPPNERDW